MSRPRKTSLVGEMVRVIAFHGGRKLRSAPMVVAEEIRCANALGPGLRHFPALVLLDEEGQRIHAYRHEVAPCR